MPLALGSSMEAAHWRFDGGGGWKAQAVCACMEKRCLCTCLPLVFWQGILILKTEIKQVVSACMFFFPLRQGITVMCFVFPSTGIFTKVRNIQVWNTLNSFLQQLKPILEYYHVITSQKHWQSKVFLKPLAPVSLTCFSFFPLITLVVFEEMNSLTAWRAGLAQAQWKKP